MVYLALYLQRDLRNGVLIMITSLTGLEAVRAQLAQVSNNIANTGATAFKASQGSFYDLYANNPLDVRSRSVGNGTFQGSVSQNMDQGAITQTGSALDLAISGDAMFVMGKATDSFDENSVITETFFTRNGSFSLSLDGYLTNTQGDLLLDTSRQPIRLPYTENYAHVADYSGELDVDMLVQDETSLNNSALIFSSNDYQNDKIIIHTDTQPSLKSDTVSLVDGKVYYANQDNLYEIGSYNHDISGNLMFDFFEKNQINAFQIYEKIVTKSADFSDAATWSLVNERYYDGKTNINGKVMPYIDNTSPDNAINGDSDPSFVDPSYLEITTVDDGKLLQINVNDGVVAEPFGIFKGPYVHTSEPLNFDAGAKISFSYNVAEGTTDEADVLAYLINSETNDYYTIFNETIGGTPEWQSVNFTVPDSGTYDVVFVGGAFDATGGQAIGARLEVKGFLLDVTEYYSALTPIKNDFNIPTDIVSQIATRIGTGIDITNTDAVFDAPSQISIDATLSNTEGSISVQGTYNLETSKTEMFETLDQFDSIEISTGGEISVNKKTNEGFDTVELGTIGTIKNVSADNLEYKGDAIFQSKVPFDKLLFGDIKTVGGGDIFQGSLEKSNTDLMTELADLIGLQTQFQANAKAIQAYTDAMAKYQNV